jgi:single-strand DNA-binding protein
MMNCVVLFGHLGADPEIRYDSQGEPIASFNMAFKAGRNKTGWVRVTAFRKLSDTCEKNLHEGSRIAVLGVLDHNTWKGKDGSQRSALSVSANSIEFIQTDGRGGGYTNNHQADSRL